MTSTLSKPVDPIPGQTNRTQSVVGALRRASDATGVDFALLLKTAKRESALNPNAKAPTSSAAGLFQFIEQTWLGTLKRHGAKHGLSGAAAAITQTSSGRYSVNDPQARASILGLRFDPQASATMAAELTAGNAAYLRGRLGRDPTGGELYAAHFLGPAGAAQLIQAAEKSPNITGASLFPQAAQSNRSIFFARGQALSASAVLANLVHTGGGAPVSVPDRTTDPTEGDDQAPGYIRSVHYEARLDRLKADQALIQLAFGSTSDPAGLLVSAQLLGAFGPEKSDE